MCQLIRGLLSAVTAQGLANRTFCSPEIPQVSPAKSTLHNSVLFQSLTVAGHRQPQSSSAALNVSSSRSSSAASVRLQTPRRVIRRKGCSLFPGDILHPLVQQRRPAFRQADLALSISFDSFLPFTIFIVIATASRELGWEAGATESPLTTVSSISRIIRNNGLRTETLEEATLDAESTCAGRGQAEDKGHLATCVFSPAAAVTGQF